MSLRRYRPEQIAATFPLKRAPAPDKSRARVPVVDTRPAIKGLERPAPDAESLLAQVAPGNWHNPMLRAVARFVACGWSDERILTRTEPYTLSGWTVEQTRREVMSMIAGARRKGFRRRPSPWEPVPGVAPAYESQALPRGEASTQLRSRIARWFDEASALAQARRELARRYKSSFAKRLPRDMAETLREEIKGKHGVASLRQAPRLAVQAAAGLGKTAAVVDEIMSRRELWKLHIWIFVPTLDLAERLAQQLIERSFDPNYAPGPEVRVMRGRLAKTNEERGPREPKTMCRKPEAAELASRLGINVFKTLCKSGAGACEHFDACPWVQQWGDHGPGVRIWSHEYLHLPKLSGFPAPDLVIVDESAVEVLAGELGLSPDRLAEPPTWAQGAAAETVSDALRRAHAALLAEGPLLETARAQGLGRELLAQAAEAAEGREDGDTGVTPGMPEDEAVERLSALEESERRKVARLLRQLSREIALERGVCHAVELRRNVAVEVDGRPERQSRVLVRWRRKVLIGKTKPLLVIDADADAEIAKRLFGEPLEHAAIPVERNAFVTQCHSSNFSRQSLVGFAGAPPDFQAKAARRLETVKTLIRRLGQVGRLLVVCPLPVRRAITGEDESKLPLSCSWEGATISHFGRIRGVDDWKGYDSVLTIGREQPPPLAVEGLARAIWDDDPDALSLPGAYAKAVRGYRLKSGEKIGTQVDAHPDPRIQRVLELKRERESLQAIDRIRLVHADRVKEVYILAKLPLDVDVDRLVSLRELLEGQGSRLQKAYWRSQGGLPLVPAILAMRWPDLFPKVRAAEWEIEKQNKADPRTPQKEIDLISLSGILRFRSVQTRGQGGAPRWSRALLAADTPYFRSRVREAVGCELIWQSPPTGRVFDKSFGRIE